MSLLKDRLAQALEYRKSIKTRGESVSQAALARHCRIKAPSVNAWFTGETKSLAGESLILAADYLKVRAEWLSSGKGPMASEANTTPGPGVKGMYPVISEVQAGNWTELCDNFQPGDADEWRPSTKNLGRCGYMLRVRGRSMTNPNGSPSFTDGMLLHVNPDIDPIPGHFVIVRRSSTNETTFKRYIQIEGAPYLEAINPDWPKEEKYLKLMPGDAWCGVVVDASLGGLI
jgi:SOS-response transcriptional repressor LexA